MLYIREDMTTTSAVARIVLVITKPYLLMLTLGAIGHRLNIPYLLHLGFWDVMLMFVAIRLAISSSPIDKWKASEKLEDVK